MKKKKLKLSLNKMTVAKINDASQIKGGSDVSHPPETMFGHTCESPCYTTPGNICDSDIDFTQGCLSNINVDTICLG